MSLVHQIKPSDELCNGCHQREVEKLRMAALPQGRPLGLKRGRAVEDGQQNRG